ncbi:MAG TPA: neutral zinc metallopeptidase [Nonomuraea sp.]|nr:neutral zinc metallopeptidase [Nonomuraea sp.]
MPPQWHRQPPRKSGIGVVGVLGIVFGSIAALFVLFVVAAALTGGAFRSETTNPVAIPTYEPDRRYDPDENEPLPTRTRETDEPEPTQEPDEPQTTQDPDEPPQSTQEPDEPQTTQEPDEPEPTETPQQQQVTRNTSLRNNTVYQVGALPRLRCPAGNVNVYNHAQLKALILKTGTCMDQAWGPILQKQGIPFRPPGWAIASVRGRGACGDYPHAGSIVPYYCPSNSTIYVSTSAIVRGNGNSRGYSDLLAWHGAISSMMAHEYGHHVQNLTGLLNSWWSSTLNTSNKGAKLALSRRLELQATCFGAMWMRSVAASYPVSTSNRGRLFWFYGLVGDQPGYPRDHGSPANNNRWFRQGWEKNKAYQCNTWLASSSTTS